MHLLYLLLGLYLTFAILSQFIEEAERSLHDAIMIVRRALKNSTVVAGGGAIDVCLHSKVCYRCHWIMLVTVLDVKMWLLLIDGNKPVLEAACTHNSWEVSAFHQLLCKSTWGVFMNWVRSIVWYMYPNILLF